jgi:branched-chain amino acid transport system substrate-binding protein
MPRPRPGRRRPVAALAVLAVLLVACSGGGSQAKGKAKVAGAPVVVGFVNQENAAVGSFPEVRADAEAAVRYVNAELGGVGGHPLRLETCVTDGSPESSQACANRLRLKKPVAVLGGVDLGAAASIPVLETAGIPYVGMSPSLGDELTATSAFLLTGGAAADLLGQAKYVTETLHAKRVGVIYIDLPGLLSTAVEAAKEVLSKKGVTDVKLVAEKPDAADFTPALNEVNKARPDVIVAVFPAQGCSRVMAARTALGIKAKVFFPGACAGQGVIDAAGGGAEGAYFSSGFVSFGDAANPEVATYLDRRRAHGARGAPSVLAQAGFAGVLDLRQILAEAQAPLSPDTVTVALRATRDHPAFMGHPFTCDRQQVFLLSAVCNADVRLLQYQGNRFTDVTGTWVNGGDLIRLFTG